MKIVHKGENILNVPNILSLYRLIIFPLIMVNIIDHNEKLYVILLFISFSTDILDGLIARKFHLVTRFGAALDNLADFGTYILAFWGILIFKGRDIQPHILILWLFLSIFLLSNLVSWIRFRKMPGLHLISCVLAGYLQGLFFILLFLVGFYAFLFYISIGMGVLGYIEKTYILLIINDIAPNTKGIFWVLKQKQNKKYLSEKNGIRNPKQLANE